MNMVSNNSRNSRINHIQPPKASALPAQAPGHDLRGDNKLHKTENFGMWDESASFAAKKKLSLQIIANPSTCFRFER